MTKDAIVQVSGLTHRFGKREILANLSFSLMHREFVSVIGPSGCGKTVLLKLLSGLIKKQNGTIQFNFESKKQVPIAMAFQRSPLFPWLTVLENIEIAMNNKMAQLEKRDMALSYLAEARMANHIHKYPHEISGGMRQKVNILRCFCSGADLILMDEPFVFLDCIQRTELQEFTLDFRHQEKKTVLFVTHDIDEAIYLSDRIWVMGGAPAKIVAEVDRTGTKPAAIEEVRANANYSAAYSLIRSALHQNLGEAAL